MPLKPLKGMHALWLSFADPARTDAYGFPKHPAGVAETELCQVDWLRFR